MTIRLSEIVEPWWEDKPAIIVATGPSLGGLDFSRFKGLGYILAVKNAMYDLPFADAVLGIDMPWMRREEMKLRTLNMPLYLGVEPDASNITEIPNATYIRRQRFDGLSLSPWILQTGGNSGFAAFNLAVLKKAKHIFLFGFDYTVDHYNPEHYKHQPRDHNARYFPRWATNYDSCVPILDKLGIKVVNASPDSTVTAFEKVTPDEALQRLARF